MSRLTNAEKVARYRIKKKSSGLCREGGCNSSHTQGTDSCLAHLLRARDCEKKGRGKKLGFFTERQGSLFDFKPTRR